MDERLFLRLTQKCPSTTATNIDSDPVPAGEVWDLDFVCVYNGSAENFKVEIQIEDRGAAWTWSYTATLATVQPVVPTRNPSLREGQRLRAVCTGSSAGGDMTLLATGWRRKIAGGGDA
jgi:hypothetical protein